MTLAARRAALLSHRVAIGRAGAAVPGRIAPEPISAFTLDENTYQGETYLEVSVADVQAARSGARGRPPAPRE